MSGDRNNIVHTINNYYHSLTCTYSVNLLLSANFGPWESGPQHGFARIQEWTPHGTSEVGHRQYIHYHNICMICTDAFLKLHNNGSQTLRNGKMKPVLNFTRKMWAGILENA